MIKRTNKRIGIPAWSIEGGFGSGAKHYAFLERFGKVAILTPDDDIRKDVDMIYLPGGLDLRPSSFNQRPLSTTSHTDVFKQYFYDNKLESYIEEGKAVFGVCLGFK